MNRFTFSTETIAKTEVTNKGGNKGRKLAPEIKWVLEELEGKGIEEAIKMTAPSAKEAMRIYFAISKYAKKHKVAVGCSRGANIVYAYKTEQVIE